MNWSKTPYYSVVANLGAWGQEKLSSRTIKSGFLSEVEAKAWGEANKQEDWGYWGTREYQIPSV